MKGKRIISSLLSMAMVFSLNAGMSFAEEVPVTEEPVIEEQPVEEQVVEEQPVIEEEPVIEEQQPTQEEPEVEQQEEAENEYPAQTFTGTTPDGKITVEVTAGEGALPKDASMRVENVNKTKVTNLVDPLIAGTVDSLSAVNVIFTDVNGNEVEPLTEIIVNIKTNELKEADRYQLVHIDQADNAERIPEEKVIGINDKEATFATDVFSIYVIVSVTESGAIDFDETFGSDHITVHAPDGAFGPGTEMVISSVDGIESLSKAIGVMDTSKKYSAYGINISFYKDGVEVEPSLPVEVTWESAYAKNNSVLVHVKDDGSAQVVSNADISSKAAVFSADSFSDWVLVSTTKQSEVDISNFTFNPSSLVATVTSIENGSISETAPKFEKYSFKDATITLSDESVDTVVEVGAFKAIYEEVDNSGAAIGNKEERTVVYYRTPESLVQSDIIVLVAGQKIQLNYEQADNKVTYLVKYNGETYTVGTETLPDDLKDMVVNGPDYAKTEGAREAVRIEIPRGFEADVDVDGTALTGLGIEPTYSHDSSDYNTIVKTGSYELRKVYDVPASEDDVVFTIDVAKRTNYTYNATLITETAYFQQNERNGRYKNSNIDGVSGTESNFTSNESTWTFATVTPHETSAPRTSYDGKYCWIMDSLSVNGETVKVPFEDTAGQSKTAETTLSSGTIITVTVTVNSEDSHTDGNRTYYSRIYTVTASNCYENITISGANLYNSWTWQEFMPDVLDNVTYDWKYHNNTWRQNWGLSQPISIANQHNDYQYWYSGNADSMRFKIDKGYGNPQMAFVTAAGNDLMNQVDLDSGLSKSGPDSDKYYSITGNPNNEGYYYFSVHGMDGNSFALLRIKASLCLYDLTYDPGSVTGATMPKDDTSGYNVVDSTTIALDKAAPVDPSGQYAFTYYTIEKDRSETHYAPSQKINLESVIDYATLKSENQYQIKLVAHWIPKEQAETKTITVHYILDGDEDTEENPPVSVEVLKDSSVYIDIDSEAVKEFMNKYNWELFYDEPESKPFIENVTEDTDVNLYMYSKYYVYHSGTGELEMHTSKEPLKNKSLKISEQAANDYLYGGYYSSCASATDVQKAVDDDRDHGTLDAGQIVQLSNLNGVNIATLGDSDRYTLVAAGKRDGYWTGAYERDMAWDSSFRGKVFYIKEVPTAYLSNYSEGIYKKNAEGNPVRNMFELTAFDDLNYKVVGYEITVTNKWDSTKTILCKSFTFQPESGDPKTRKADNLTFGITNPSYLAALDFNKEGIFEANNIISLRPYWITPDDVRVRGKTRTISLGDLKLNSISVSD